MALYDPVRESLVAMRESCPKTLTGQLTLYFMTVTLYGIFFIAGTTGTVIDYVTLFLGGQDDLYPRPIGKDDDSYDDDDDGGYPPDSPPSPPQQPKTPSSSIGARRFNVLYLC